jgi:hypothetical protein
VVELDDGCGPFHGSREAGSAIQVPKVSRRRAGLRTSYDIAVAGVADDHFVVADGGFVIAARHRRGRGEAQLGS